MTVQFPQIDSTEPRLLPDSSAQRAADRSFEEKLKLEQARLGLLFSPFSQLQALFSSVLTGGFDASEPQTGSKLYDVLQQSTQPAEGPKVNNNNSSPASRPSPLQVFESLPAQASNKGFLQQLLTETGWLVPNLSAQPQFNSAFLEGRLQPKFDLQLLIDKIAEQVKLVKSKGQVELSMTLKPEELGEIFLALTSRSGIVSIQIQASPETKKLIDSRRAELESSLKKAHVDFDRIQITEVEKNA